MTTSSALVTQVVTLIMCALLHSSSALTNNQQQQQLLQQLPNIKAAVLVPGFLTGSSEFRALAQSLTERGIPTIAVPMANWHWLPCLGGRSMRPMLERLDFAVQHVAAAAGIDQHEILDLPAIDYNALDLWKDFRDTPGGVFKVGGSDKVDEYPIVEPQGRFPLPTTEPQGKIALIGHSAGGWISRIYLSERNYGGRVYRGADYVHSLVTLGTPHGTAPGPAFEGIKWCNEETDVLPIRQLAVAGTGFMGGDWGALTQGAYSFCCAEGSDGTSYTGDGVTPVFSALALKGAEQLVVEGETHHFCWADAFGGDIVAPELTKDHAEGRPWYGSDSVLDQWAGWLMDV